MREWSLARGMPTATHSLHPTTCPSHASGSGLDRDSTGVALFSELCAGIQEGQPTLAGCAQDEFIGSLESNVSDAFRRVNTTRISCLIVLLSLTSNDQDSESITDEFILL